MIILWMMLWFQSYWHSCYCLLVFCFSHFAISLISCENVISVDVCNVLYFRMYTFITPPCLVRKLTELKSNDVIHFIADIANVSDLIRICRQILYLNRMSHMWMLSHSRYGTQNGKHKRCSVAINHDLSLATFWSDVKEDLFFSLSMQVK